MASCFGARSTVRSYFVLYGQADSGPWKDIPVSPRVLFPGTVRVRSLNADDVYEKFQIVVRKSPYELRYSDSNVWAVKPADMVSDIVGRMLADANVFAAVTRELGDTRPDYTLGGELHAIELYDSDDRWFAHLSMTLTLTRFSTGERLWSFDFDQRKEVQELSFSHGVRALSELVGSALAESVKQLDEVAAGRWTGKVPAEPAFTPRKTEVKRIDAAPAEPTEEAPATPEPIYVPEQPRD
ncbi:PqiC family protein [Myxococcota bacterium]|nr:PqiC family protein [Myxococcota bacterium]